MKKLRHYGIFTILISFVFFSCGREDRLRTKLIGEWNFHTAKESKLFGSNDVTGDYEFEKLIFNEDKTLELYYADDTVAYQGEWNTKYEICTSGTGEFETSETKTRLELSIYGGSELALVNYIERLKSDRLKFRTDDDYTDTVFEFVK
jgi:hypothetical protein